jgi:hypothetical protein
MPTRNTKRGTVENGEKLIVFIIFLIAIFLITISLLYLSVFENELSFSIYSETPIAIAFASLGIALILIAVFSVLTITTVNKKSRYSYVYAGGLFLILICSLTIGIWGIVSDVEGTIYYKIRQQMFKTIQNYDENNIYNEYTKKMDLLQIRYCFFIAKIHFFYLKLYFIFNKNKKDTIVVV